MTSTTTHTDVKMLQQAAGEALMEARAKKSATAPSRAAQLAAIDLLSRWSSLSLALIAGLSVFLAIQYSAAAPLRALIWLAPVFLSLIACRRIQHRYRAGAANGTRPFRWRASFTSALAVLATAFAAAPFLLAPAQTPLSVEPMAHLMAMTLFGGVAAAFALSPHRNSAIAVLAPTISMPAFAAFVDGRIFLAATAIIVGAIGAAAALFLSSLIMKRFRRLYPRSTFMRRARVGPSSHTDIEAERFGGAR